MLPMVWRRIAGATLMGFNNAVQQRPEFVPTTNKELKAIEKRARQREQAKKEKTEEPRAKHRWPKGPQAIREALQQRQPVRVYRAQLFDTLLEVCKDSDQKPPAYRLYEKERDADASFMFDMQQVLARLNWRQLAQIVDAAVGVPIPSRTFSTAFWFAMQVIVQAFEVENYLESKKGEQEWVTIKDRDALDQWPIPGRKRKSSNDKEETDMLVDADNRRKMSARAADDEEDDEAEAADDGDEEEEDEEDEKPARKKTTAKKKAGGFGGKRKAAKDDDDDEDEKPARKKKAKRAAKDDDDDDDDKPARKRTPAAEAVSDKDTLAKVKERDKGGLPTKVLALIPKKGITVKALIAACKEEELPIAKVRPAIDKYLVKYGYVAVK